MGAPNNTLANDPQPACQPPVAHNEQETPQAGWFITSENQEPLLIYWRQKGDTVIGFRLSYVQLMMDIANNVQVSPEEQQIVRVSESGRQIFQNKRGSSESAGAAGFASTGLPAYPVENQCLWR